MSTSRLAKTTLFALFWANFLNFFDRQVIAALAPSLQQAWSLSDVQLGLLATAFEVTFALALVPTAILADRWLRSRVVAVALALWSGAMALTGLAGSYPLLLLSRAALGLGEAGYGPSALAWLSDLFPPALRSRAISIHDTALMLGTAAGYALGGTLAAALGWRPVFFLPALLGIGWAAVLRSLPEPARGESDYRSLGIEPHKVAVQTIPLRTALGELLSVPTLLVTYGVTVLVNLATAGLIYWLPSFAVRQHGMGEGEAGLIIGIVTVAAGAAGVLFGGVVADRVLQRTPTARLLTIGASYALGFPLAMLALMATNRAAFFGLAAAAVFLFTFYYPCVGPLVHQVTPPELRATAMGIALFLGHILGSAPSSALVGWLSDITGDLSLGLAGTLSVSLLVVLLAVGGRRCVGSDSLRMLDRLAARAVAADSTPTSGTSRAT